MSAKKPKSMKAVLLEKLGGPAVETVVDVKVGEYQPLVEMVREPEGKVEAVGGSPVPAGIGAPPLITWGEVWLVNGVAVNMEPRFRFGSLLRTVRESMGWGLRQFAEKIDMDPTTFSKMERGLGPPLADDRMLEMTGLLYGAPNLDLAEKLVSAAAEWKEDRGWEALAGESGVPEGLVEIEKLDVGQRNRLALRILQGGMGLSDLAVECGLPEWEVMAYARTVQRASQKLDEESQRVLKPTGILGNLPEVGALGYLDGWHSRAVRGFEAAMAARREVVGKDGEVVRVVNEPAHAHAQTWLAQGVALAKLMGVLTREFGGGEVAGALGPERVESARGEMVWLPPTMPLAKGPGSGGGGLVS